MLALSIWTGGIALVVAAMVVTTRGIILLGRLTVKPDETSAFDMVAGGIILTLNVASESYI